MLDGITRIYGMQSIIHHQNKCWSGSKHDEDIQQSNKPIILECIEMIEIEKMKFFKNTNTR